MKNVLIFGTGSTGQSVYKKIKNSVKVIGFLDNDQTRWGKKFDHIPILGNAEILDHISYDEIIVCSLTGHQIIKEELLKAGVSAEKIRTDFVETQVYARINFLHDYAQLNRDIYQREYAVAEGGIFQGDFSKEINACFPDSTLYLFDTFHGFDERDMAMEKEKGYSNQSAGHLSITSEQIVLDKLPFRDKAVIRKGYFPETTRDLEETKYFFVSLDFDLYNPTLGGLQFFYPRLVKGGCMLVHDYFNSAYLGVEKAVEDFEKDLDIRLHKFPIGDHCSIGIIKMVQ